MYEPNLSAPVDGAWVTAEDGNLQWSQHHEALVLDAVQSWKADSIDMIIHMQDELETSNLPMTGGAKVRRAQAAALIWEVAHRGTKTPLLYRGARTEARGFRSWTSNRKTADLWAKKNRGEVWELPPGKKGLRLSKYWGADPESEWIVFSP